MPVWKLSLIFRFALPTYIISTNELELKKDFFLYEVQPGEVNDKF